MIITTNIEPARGWFVAQKHEIENDVLVQRGDPAGKWYFPIEHPRLPEEVANITPGDVPQLLRFADQRGQFGYVTLMRRRGRNFKEIKAINESMGTLGDPLEWVWNHVRAVQTAVKLVSLLVAQDESGISKFLDKLRGDGPAIVVPKGAQVDNHILINRTDLEPLHEGGIVLQDILSANVDDMTSLSFLAGRDGSGAQLVTFQALINAIYLQVGIAWQQGFGYFKCQYRRCRRWNTQESGMGRKRKFCPAGDNDSESRCARMERYYSTKSGAKEAHNG